MTVDHFLLGAHLTAQPQQPQGKDRNPSLYRSMIGRLLYLTASRPDISYSVGMCARYQANPKESHMAALKRIIKYVKTIAEFVCGTVRTQVMS